MMTSDNAEMAMGWHIPEKNISVSAGTLPLLGQGMRPAIPRHSYA